MTRKARYTQINKTTGNATGQTVVLGETATGSGNFRNVTTPGTVSARFGLRMRNEYAFPQALATIAPEQIDNGGYYSPRYWWGLSHTFLFSLDKMKRLGWSLWASQTLTDDELTVATPARCKQDIAEQNLLTGTRGNLFWEKSLQQVFEIVYPQVSGDTRYGMVAPNIETTLQWGAPASAHATYTNEEWEAGAKDISILCETDGVTRTLDQLWNAQPDGALWYAEEGLRFVNRICLIQKIFREKRGPSMKWSFGTSYKFGDPSPSWVTSTNLELPNSTVNVRQLTGGSDTITLNEAGGTPHTYTLTGKSAYAGEDFHIDYDYVQYFRISSQDYQEIWVQKKEGTQNYPYLWSKIQPSHVGARVKGRNQGLKYRMNNVSGLTPIPIIRQVQLFFEANIAGIVNGVPTAARVPFQSLKSTIPVEGGGPAETPKVWLPPVWVYTMDMWQRFLNADGGHYQFGVPRRSLLNDASHQHHMHTIDGLYQARWDMQRIEHFMDNSTLVENPEVQLSGVGSFTAYDGATAFQNGNPAYALRYWTVAGTTQIEIIGSVAQADTVSRTDKIRVPGLFGGCVFKVTLTGQSAHLFSFSIPAAGYNGEIETGNVSAGNLAGYGGLARTDGTTGGGGGTTDPEDPEDPETPPAYVPAQECWRRVHAINWTNNTNFNNMKDEALRWKQRGATMFKFTILPEQWYNPTGKANLIAFGAYCRSIGLKIGIHFQYSFPKVLIGVEAAYSYFTLDKGEKFNTNGSLDVYPDNVPISLSYIRPWVENPSTWGTLDSNNPMYRVSVDVVQDACDLIKPDTTSCGRTDEFEMGIGNKVSPLTNARVGMYEDAMKQWFKDKMYQRAGGTLAQVRTLVDKSDLTDAQIVPPTPQYYNSGDGFWDTWNGTGKGSNWNRAWHYHFGIWVLENWLDMFKYYAQLGNPGQHITVEAGNIDGNQARPARTFNWGRLTKTAQATQVNLAPDANWRRGADIHGSRIKYHGADWDNIWDSATGKYKRNYSIANGGGTITQDEAATQIASYVLAGGSWGYFGGSEDNLVELHNKVLQKIGFTPGRAVPTINRTPTILYYTDKFRRRENSGLESWVAGANMQIVEETGFF